METDMPEPGTTRKPKSADARGGQRRGEEPVQVNDAYDGGKPAPEQPNEDKQHPTGG
jgi:hypothetical protein